MIHASIRSERGIHRGGIARMHPAGSPTGSALGVGNLCAVGCCASPITTRPSPTHHHPPQFARRIDNNKAATSTARPVASLVKCFPKDHLSAEGSTFVAAHPSQMLRNSNELDSGGVPRRDPPAQMQSPPIGGGIAATAGASCTPTRTQNTLAVKDPIDYLNTTCASEQSLQQSLPQLQESVRESLSHFDEAISLALSRQSETSEKTLHALPQALSSVRALQHRVLLVKEKAIDSEKAVLSITSDMKRLDSAKRHLQRTITTLKRLHMLVHAVEQLRQTTTVDVPSYSSTTSFVVMDYRSAAQLVEATRLLMEHFDAYTAKVEPMKLLARNINNYQETLTQNLKRCFRIAAFGSQQALELETLAFSTKPTSSAGIDGGSGTRDEDINSRLLVSASDSAPSDSDLEGGVMLLNALGDTARGEFVRALCQDFLCNYVRDFEPPFRQETSTKKRINSFKATQNDTDPAKPLSGLAEMEKRFNWFQDVLQSAANTFRMVPTRWNLLPDMSRSFLQMTRSHILALMDGPRRDPDSENASVLLKAIQKTTVFEKDLTAWLEKECGVAFRSGRNAERELNSRGEQAAQTICEPLLGVASSAFEDYMGPYIRVEEQSMDEQLAEAHEDQSVDTRGELPVFISSTKLFITIRGSITRCTALTTGKPFFQLYRSFQDSLRKYSQVLDSKLPGPLSGSISGISIPGSFGQPLLATAASGSGGSIFRLAKHEEVKVCHVISTCEYCVDTLEALEDLVRDIIDEQHGARVDMSPIQDAFYDVATKAIRVLVSGLTIRAESGLKHLANTSWGSFDTVGEESDYVRTMHEEIEPFVSCVRSLLPMSYFRSFCDKFAASFSSLYYDSLVRLKKISQPGTQQLLLDVYNLKTLFLRLPLAESHNQIAENKTKMGKGGGSTIAPAVYTKMVQTQFGKIETLLKLVGTPNELLIENFKVQWPGGSVAELQVVLNLKGLKRADQVPFLEKFGAVSEAATKKDTSSTTASAALVSERVQALQDQGSSVAAKVNSDLSQMKLKVEDFRKTWRGGNN